MTFGMDRDGSIVSVTHNSQHVGQQEHNETSTTALSMLLHGWNDIVSVHVMCVDQPTSSASR
jgi:hypothetical protein